MLLRGRSQPLCFTHMHHTARLSRDARTKTDRLETRQRVLETTQSALEAGLGVLDARLTVLDTRLGVLKTETGNKIIYAYIYIYIQRTAELRTRHRA